MEDSVGKKIKRLRKEKGLSVDDLAKRIGKNRATVYRYEKDEILEMPYTVLIPLAAALDTTPAYLMGRKNNFQKHKVEAPEIINPAADKLKKLWLDQIGEVDWTEDEFQQIVNYALFIKSQRKDDK